MEQLQCAKLILKTNQMSLGFSGYRGSVDANRTNITWNNLNFRLLLGEMYDMYDLFNLHLISVNSDNNIDGVIRAGMTPSDELVNLNLRGLNFINSSYDTTMNCNTSSTILASYDFYEDYTKQYHNSITTFGKGNDMCNLNIFYTRIFDDAPPASTANVPFPHMTFIFNIYGIPRIPKV